MLEYRKAMPQCARIRPHWDLGALLDAGFASVKAEASVSPRIHDESEQVLYRSTPMFMLIAVKGL
jgi:hypothetical protein